MLKPLHLILGVSKQFITITLSIATFIGIIYLLIYVGLKGFISFVLGMTVMAYLILSKNAMMLWFIEFAQAEHYIKEIKIKK